MTICSIRNLPVAHRICRIYAENQQFAPKSPPPSTG